MDQITVRPAKLSLIMALISPVIFLLMFVTPAELNVFTFSGLLNVGLSIALSCVGLASGIQGLRIIRSDPETFSGKGMAIAGIALCSIELIPTVLFVGCGSCSLMLG